MIWYINGVGKIRKKGSEAGMVPNLVLQINYLLAFPVSIVLFLAPMHPFGIVAKGLIFPYLFGLAQPQICYLLKIHELKG